MPGDIECRECGRSCARMAFSNIQLKKYEENVQRRRSARNYNQNTGGKSQYSIKADLPTCRKCNGEPPTHLTCYDCEKDLALDRFSKAQRKVGDKRLCIDCSQERVDKEPRIEDAVYEEKIYDDDKNKTGGGTSAWSTTDMRSTLPSITNTRAPSAISSRVQDQVPVHQQSSFMQSQRRRRGDDGDTDETATQMGASPTQSQLSTTSAGWDDSNAIEQSFRNPGKQPTSNTQGVHGWHKQGAYKKTHEDRVQDRIKREKERQVRDQLEEEEKQSSSEADSDESDFEL